MGCLICFSHQQLNTRDIILFKDSFTIMNNHSKISNILICRWKTIHHFFLKRLKWNILPTQNVLPSTWCAKEKQKVWNNIYKTGNKRQQEKLKEKNKLTAAQHCEGIKPPTVIIERELNEFLLQPRERKWLYFVHYTHSRAIFVIENYVISFFHISQTVANQMTFTNV